MGAGAEQAERGAPPRRAEGPRARCASPSMGQVSVPGVSGELVNPSAELLEIRGVLGKCRGGWSRWGQWQGSTQGPDQPGSQLLLWASYTGALCSAAARSFLTRGCGPPGAPVSVPLDQGLSTTFFLEHAGTQGFRLGPTSDSPSAKGSQLMS